MNQILSVEMPQEKNRNRRKGKTNINSVIVVFAIILIIFGIGLTASGAYSYYRNITSNSGEINGAAAGTKPVITTERESSSLINIVVTHDKGISEVVYTINDGEEIKINGEDKTNVKERVELPIGESTINITAKDINGIKSSYQNAFEVQQKPEITLEQVNTKISIKVTSKINIQKVTFYWDEEKENAENRTVQDLQYETLVDVLEGTHTLNIVATDEEGNETTKTQKIKGVNKPKLNVTTDGQSFIINATDEDELSKIEVKLNENEMKTEEINQKEYNNNIPLENGENKLIVTVYNKNGLSEVSKVKYTKE